ncbi:MAG TPA: nuclear transport factor 2 family protein [Longimicrobium sp.]|jgi:hypothetical protein
MPRLVLLASLLILAACGAPPSPAMSPQPGASASDQAAVLGTIHGFLDGLRARDTTVMAQHVDSLTRMTLLRPGRDGTTQVWVLTASEFMRVATRPGQPGLDEPIRNPVVHVNGDLASVWAEYQVRREGTVTHCGYDAFHLARRGGRWKILNVSDTFQQTGCGPAWPVETR